MNENYGEAAFDAVKRLLAALHEVKTHLEGHQILFAALPLRDLFTRTAYPALLSILGDSISAEENSRLIAKLETPQEFGLVPDFLTPGERSVLSNSLELFAENFKSIQFRLLETSRLVNKINADHEEERRNPAGVFLMGAAVDAEIKRKGEECQRHVFNTAALIAEISSTIAEGAFLLSELSEGSKDLAFAAQTVDGEFREAEDRAIRKLSPFLT